MNTALIIIYALMIFGLGIISQQHGQTTKKVENFWWSLFITLINLLLIWWALGWQFI